MHKVPQPLSDGYEQRLLGSCLAHQGAVSLAVELIVPDCFRVSAHREVWSAAVALWQEGKPVELVTVAERLQQEGKVGEVGGYEYLADLYEAACPGHSTNEYARKVRDHALLRRLHSAGAEIARKAKEPDGPPDAVLEASERLIFDVTRGMARGETSTLAQAVGLAYDRLDERKAGGSPGLMTGWTDMDLLTAGLHPGELILVAARPGVGKSAVATALAREAAKTGPVLFCSLEMTREEVAERLLCAEAGIDGHLLRQAALSPGDAARLTAAGALLSALPVTIDDAGQQSATRIGGSARRMAAGPSGLALVVIDYIQLVEPENRKDPRYEQVGKVSRRLKQLAKEVRVPVVALAQLNRGADERAGQRPRMRDLRESGNLEQDADVVWLLHPAGQALEVIVEKQRHGPTGDVSLFYDRARHRLTDIDRSPFGGSP